MNLELDHFFILVKPEAAVADRLVTLGMREGTSNRHQGQGTANRRFYFKNGMLEFLWVHDALEAKNGPGRKLFFPERANDPNASPFGVILHRKDNTDLAMPFDGWQYQPEYFSPPWAFHVGSNSNQLLEPLCFYVPFIEPGATKRERARGTFKTVDQVNIYTPATPLSNVLQTANSADRLTVCNGAQHLMEITFNAGQANNQADLRPDIPLRIFW